MKQVIRLIEDLSFMRFIRELVHYVKKHPDATLEACWLGDDERAEDNFMFHAKIEYTVDD